MKKAMKLVWMALFALPLISLTACGDDDDKEPELTLGEITYSADVNNASATFSVPVTTKNITDDVKVSYTFNSVTSVATGSNGNYAFTLSNLTLGDSYSVTVKAEAAGLTTSQTVSFSMPLFKDYSVLLDKSRQGVINYMGTQPTASDDDYQAYYVNEGNVEYVFVYFTEFDDQISDDVEMVYSKLVSTLKSGRIVNYLESLYTFDEVDEDNWYWYYDEATEMYAIYMMDDNAIQYAYVEDFYDDDDFDAYSKATATNVKANIKAAVKAAKARR